MLYLTSWITNSMVKTTKNIWLISDIRRKVSICQKKYINAKNLYLDKRNWRSCLTCGFQNLDLDFQTRAKYRNGKTNLKCMQKCLFFRMRYVTYAIAAVSPVRLLCFLWCSSIYQICTLWHLCINTIGTYIHSKQ